MLQFKIFDNVFDGPLQVNIQGGWIDVSISYFLTNHVDWYVDTHISLLRPLFKQILLEFFLIGRVNSPEFSEANATRSKYLLTWEANIFFFGRRLALVFYVSLNVHSSGFTKMKWSDTSPELDHPLDFCLWGYMIGKLNKVKHMILTLFKSYLVRNVVCYRRLIICEIGELFEFK